LEAQGFALIVQLLKSLDYIYPPVTKILEVLNKLDPKGPDILELIGKYELMDEKDLKTRWDRSHLHDDLVFHAYANNFYCKREVPVEMVVKFLEKRKLK
jgi:hypothetical protein